MKKILLVEDDVYIFKILVKRLEKEGFVVLIAETAERAFDFLGKDAATIGLVLLDLILPGTSGYDILTRIRNTPATRELPVIVFSNLGQEEEIQKAMDLKANEFFVKANTNLNDLVERINFYLKR